MRFYNSYWTLAVFAALLHSNASFGQTMPLAIPNYSYTPRVEMPFMGMPMNGSHKGSQQLLASRDGSGSYQLPDGSWHKASRLVFDGIRLIVKDSTIAKQRFTSETVQQLVVKQDTFLVVRDLPGRQVAHPKPDFLHSCVNSQGVRLLALYDSRSKTWRIASGSYKVLLAHDAADAGARTITVKLPKQVLNVNGKPQK